MADPRLAQVLGRELAWPVHMQSLVLPRCQRLQNMVQCFVRNVVSAPQTRLLFLWLSLSLVGLARQAAPRQAAPRPPRDTERRCFATHREKRGGAIRLNQILLRLHLPRPAMDWR